MCGVFLAYFEVLRLIKGTVEKCGELLIKFNVDETC